MDEKAIELLFLLVLAFLLPPLSVFLIKKFDGHFIINILLTIFGFWIFGVIHAVYLVYLKSKESA